MTDTPKHSVSVAGIVINEEGRILVVKRRDNGNWEPPGGVLELDEQLEDGVKREVKEETGIEIEVERLSGVYKNMQRHIVALVFRCRPVTTVIQTSDETDTVAWLRLGEINELMDEAYSLRVSDALSETPKFRAHDGVRLTPKGKQ